MDRPAFKGQCDNGTVAGTARPAGGAAGSGEGGLALGAAVAELDAAMAAAGRLEGNDAGHQVAR